MSTGSVSVPDAGRGSDCDVLWGWFFSANLSYDFNQRWGAMASLQFQDLGKYSHDFGGRVCERDLSKSIFISIGLSRRF